ncbi:MAG: MFS transporter [Dehalococcoidia bacterium]
MAHRLFPGIYEGWIVVFSGGLVILTISATFFYGFGVFFTDILKEFGWSVAATSLAFSLRSEIGGLGAPLVGIGIDRYGARRMVMFSVVMTGIGVLLLSFIQNLWQFYAAMIVIAIGSSGAGGQTALSAVATWFQRRRSMAMSLTTVGGGLGGVLVVGIAWLVEEFGWRIALRAMVAGIVVVGVGLGSQVRSRPRGHPQPIDGREYLDADGRAMSATTMWGIPPLRAVRTRGFIFSSLAMIMLSFATTAFLVHQVPFLERLGVSKADASWSVALLTIASVGGRVGLGMLGDRIPKTTLLAVCGLLVAAGILVLSQASTLQHAVIATLLLAPGFGGAMPIRPAMMADYFGTKYFGSLNGTAALINTTGGAVGPWVVGRIVDATGVYQLGWYTAAGAALLSIPLVLLATAPHRLAEHYRTEAERSAAGSAVGAAGAVVPSTPQGTRAP